MDPGLPRSRQRGTKSLRPQPRSLPQPVCRRCCQLTRHRCQQLDDRQHRPPRHRPGQSPQRRHVPPPIRGPARRGRSRQQRGCRPHSLPELRQSPMRRRLRPAQSLFRRSLWRAAPARRRLLHLDGSHSPRPRCRHSGGEKRALPRSNALLKKTRNGAYFSRLQ